MNVFQKLRKRFFPTRKEYAPNIYHYLFKLDNEGRKEWMIKVRENHKKYKKVCPDCHGIYFTEECPECAGIHLCGGYVIYE